MCLPLLLTVRRVGELCQMTFVFVATAVHVKLYCNGPCQLQCPLLPERTESSRLSLIRSNQSRGATMLCAWHYQATLGRAVGAQSQAVGASEPKIVGRHGGSTRVRRRRDWGRPPRHLGAWSLRRRVIQQEKGKVGLPKVVLQVMACVDIGRDLGNPIWRCQVVQVFCSLCKPCQLVPKRLHHALQSTNTLGCLLEELSTA